jgi:hypothetical protein
LIPFVGGHGLQAILSLEVQGKQQNQTGCKEVEFPEQRDGPEELLALADWHAPV